MLQYTFAVLLHCSIILKFCTSACKTGSVVIRPRLFMQIHNFLEGPRIVLLTKRHTKHLVLGTFHMFLTSRAFFTILHLKIPYL